MFPRHFHIAAERDRAQPVIRRPDSFMKEDLPETDGKGEHPDFTRLCRDEVAELMDKNEDTKHDDAQDNFD